MPRSSSTDVTRGEDLELTVDGQRVRVSAGETLATAVLSSDALIFNRTGGDQPRSAYCNMGTCFECQVRVAVAEGQPMRWQRACMVPAQAGMVVVTGQSRQAIGENRDG